MISGSFQGPLSDLRHPPWSRHEQFPPRKSGNWLQCINTRSLPLTIPHWSYRNTESDTKWRLISDLASITFSNFFWNLLPKTCSKNIPRFHVDIRFLLWTNAQYITKSSLYVYLWSGLRIEKSLCCVPEQSKTLPSIHDVHLMQCL